MNTFITTEVTLCWRRYVCKTGGVLDPKEQGYVFFILSRRNMAHKEKKEIFHNLRLFKKDVQFNSDGILQKKGSFHKFEDTSRGRIEGEGNK